MISGTTKVIKTIGTHVAELNEGDDFSDEEQLEKLQKKRRLNEYPKEVYEKVNELLEMHKFERQYGARRVVSDLRTANFPEDDIPDEVAISNRLHYYRSKNWGYNNVVETLESKLEPYILNKLEDLSSKGDDSVLLIGYDKTTDDTFRLGDGSDNDLFYTCLTTKSMIVQTLSKLTNVPFVLHLDATFKCNDNEFPIFIMGVTDCQNQFHPLALSVISHRSTAIYERQ